MDVGVVALMLAVGREVLGLGAPSLVNTLRHRLCEGHGSLSRQLSPGEAGGLFIPRVRVRGTGCQAAILQGS